MNRRVRITLVVLLVLGSVAMVCASLMFGSADVGLRRAWAESDDRPEHDLLLVTLDSQQIHAVLNNRDYKGPYQRP